MPGTGMRCTSAGEKSPRHGEEEEEEERGAEERQTKIELNAGIRDTRNAEWNRRK